MDCEHVNENIENDQGKTCIDLVGETDETREEWRQRVTDDDVLAALYRYNPPPSIDRGNLISSHFVNQ